MPRPDPLKIKMLHPIPLEKLKPPPLPKIIEEKYNNRISIYLTDFLKTKYEALMDENEKWSEVGRKALKVYFEGAHSIQMPDIEEYHREIVALVTHRQLPTQPRNLEEQEKWDLARKQAVARKVVQEPLHLDFRAECVPELKEKFAKVGEIEDWKERYTEMGLEHTEIHKSPKVDDKAFNEFLSLTKELNKKGFADCKWKQQVKEVAV